jgi:hypothetical protein
MAYRASAKLTPMIPLKRIDVRYVSVYTPDLDQVPMNLIDVVFVLQMETPVFYSPDRAAIRHPQDFQHES